MRRGAPAWVLALLWPLAACLGSEATEPLPPAGSYVLVVADARLTYAVDEAPPFSRTPESVGLGVPLQVQLSLDGAEAVAVVSAPWGTPAEYRGMVGDGSGPVVFTAVDDPVRITGETVWEAELDLDRLTLDVRVSGDELVLWSDGARFEGSEELWSTDVFAPYDAEGRLRVRVDDIAPQARLGPIGAWAEGRPLYPWEPVFVELSEPATISEDDVTVPGAAHSVRVVDRGSRIELVPAGWWPPGETLSVQLPAGYADPAGNAGLELDGTVPTVGDLTPGARIDLDDGASPSVRSWGGEPTEDIPSFAGCESTGTGTGCLGVVRPVGGTVGVFARVADPAGFDTVRVVLRALGMESRLTGSRDADLELLATVTPEGSADTRETRELVRVDRAALPLPYVSDSDWITVDIPLASSVESAAVAIEVRGYAGEVAPIGTQAPTLVLVDWIEVL